MDLDAEIKRINRFVTDGNYHAALNIALSCMNDGQRNNRQPQVDRFLGIIKSIYESLAEEFGSDEYLDNK